MTDIQQTSDSKALRRYERILKNARRGLSALGYDVTGMTNAEVEVSCVALNAWLTQGLTAARELGRGPVQQSSRGQRTPAMRETNRPG